MSNSSTLFTQFSNGKLTVNEFAVLIAVSTKANSGGVVSGVTTSEIADDLYNNLSRHAVARALRSLQKKNFINWQTPSLGGRGRTSDIVVR